MARPGLTIALLLTTPDLVEACQQWLPESRYNSLELFSQVGAEHGGDLTAALAAHQDEIDAVVVEQQLSLIHI